MTYLMEPQDKAAVVRFRDPLSRLSGFTGEILVHCPRCDSRATIRPEPQPEDKQPRFWTSLRPRRLTCLSCGFTDRWTVATGTHGGVIPPKFSGPNDPYFGALLWLRTGCCGHMLWAYNLEHVNLLENYVSAQLENAARSPAP